MKIPSFQKPRKKYCYERNTIKGINNFSCKLSVLFQAIKNLWSKICHQNTFCQGFSLVSGEMCKIEDRSSVLLNTELLKVTFKKNHF